MSNGKVMIIHLIVGWIKNILSFRMSYFPSYSHSKNKTEVELDLSIYVTKSDSKNASGVDHPNLLKKMI